MEGHTFKFSALIFLLALVLILVGLCFGLMWFFRKGECITSEDEMNYKRAVLTWIGAATFILLLMFFSAKEGVSAAKHTVKAALSGGAASLL